MKRKKWLFLVIDASGSISYYGLKNQIIDVCNSLIKIHENDADDNILCVKTFSSYNRIKDIYNGISEGFLLNNNNYELGNQTAIYDALYGTLEYVEKLAKVYKDDIFIVNLLTDGYENNSRKHDRDSLSKIIKNIGKLNNVTLVVQMPETSRSEIKVLGLDADNVLLWEQNRKGAENVKQFTSGGLNSFYACSNSNPMMMSTRNFYVKPDLRGVKVENKLDDLSDMYGIFTSREECEIRDFVEKQCKRRYVKGEAFYKLKKTEVVQPNKEILIFDKSNTELYGGSQARSLIGLPINTNAKLVPGEHDKYDIFVQSTSVNRKIQPGDKVVVKND